MGTISAILTLLGVLVGVYGTHQMTMAYHPFGGAGVIRNFFRMVVLFLIFRWNSAKTLIGDAAFFGEMNREDRTQSLMGIYILGVSFLLQTAGAAFAVADLIITAHK